MPGDPITRLLKNTTSKKIDRYTDLDVGSFRNFSERVDNGEIPMCDKRRPLCSFGVTVAPMQRWFTNDTIIRRPPICYEERGQTVRGLADIWIQNLLVRRLLDPSSMPEKNIDDEDDLWKTSFCTAVDPYLVDVLRSIFWYALVNYIGLRKLRIKILRDLSRRASETKMLNHINLEWLTYGSFGSGHLPEVFIAKKMYKETQRNVWFIKNAKWKKSVMVSMKKRMQKQHPDMEHFEVDYANSSVELPSVSDESYLNAFIMYHMRPLQPLYSSLGGYYQAARFVSRVTHKTRKPEVFPFGSTYRGLEVFVITNDETNAVTFEIHEGRYWKTVRDDLPIKLDHLDFRELFLRSPVYSIIKTNIKGFMHVERDRIVADKVFFRYIKEGLTERNVRTIYIEESD